MKKGYVTKNGPVFDKILPTYSEYCPVFKHKVRSDYIPVVILTQEEVVEIKGLMKSATWEPYYYTKVLRTLEGKGDS